MWFSTAPYLPLFNNQQNLYSHHAQWQPFHAAPEGNRKDGPSPSEFFMCSAHAQHGCIILFVALRLNCKCSEVAVSQVRKKRTDQRKKMKLLCKDYKGRYFFKTMFHRVSFFFAIMQYVWTNTLSLNCFYTDTKASPNKSFQLYLKSDLQKGSSKQPFPLEKTVEIAVKSFRENICVNQPPFWKYIVLYRISVQEISVDVGYNFNMREKACTPQNLEVWRKQQAHERFRSDCFIPNNWFKDISWREKR